MPDDWTERLSEEYEWRDTRPEDVAEEARELGIDSLADLLGYLDDAPENCDCGDEKWRYHRNYRKKYTSD